MLRKNLYQKPMQSWPGLDRYGKKIKLACSDYAIFYFEVGEKSAMDMIMIHGLGDEADTWRHILEPFSSEFHIIALDLPGFGRSDLPAKPLTPSFLLDCLLGLADQLKLQKPIWMGNSLGAILAHAMAIKHPERVNALVLGDGSLFKTETMGDLGMRLMYIPYLGEWLYNRLRKNPQSAYDSLRNVYFDLDQMSQTDRDFLFTRVNQRVWSNSQRAAYFSTLRNLGPWVKSQQSELDEKLAKLQTRTLVIRGEFDQLFSESTARQVVKKQPNAEYVELSKAGHLPHQEAADKFITALRQWLGGI